MHTVVREDVACPLGINEVHQQRGLGVMHPRAVSPVCTLHADGVKHRLS